STACTSVRKHCPCRRRGATPASSSAARRALVVRGNPVAAAASAGVSSAGPSSARGLTASLRTRSETTDTLRPAAGDAERRLSSSPYQEYGFLLVPCAACPDARPRSVSFASSGILAPRGERPPPPV